MRIPCFLLASIVCALTITGAARAAAPTSLELSGNVIDYYSNRFTITSDGDVRVSLSDGTVLRGNTFAMDLKLNRFIVAGNVRIDGPQIHTQAAAFAGFPDLDRNYILTEGGTPDRVTFYGLDFAHPHPGREQPGDAFIFPDLTAERPYIIAHTATIIPKTNVQFNGTKLSVLGLYTPVPGYLLNFSANPNFEQNAFSGATADIGLPYHGARDAISAFHLRYDTYRGAYLSFDQHFVHGRDYAVFSVNPLTQNQRQYNAILYKRASPNVEVRVFYQLSTLSVGLNEPHDASSYTQLQVNVGLKRYALSTVVDQYNNSLLANAQDLFTIYGLRQSGHPIDGTVTLQSFEDRLQTQHLIGFPLLLQYRAGFGLIHDGYGIETLEGPTFGGVAYPTQYQHFLGATLYTPSIRVAKETTFSVKSDEQRQWFTLPHHVDTTTTTATLARTPLTVKKPSLYLAYNVTNIGDYYGDAQLAAYPAFTDVVTTQYGTYSGLAAFRGLATSRSYLAGFVYTPTQYFNLNLQLKRAYDTPAPVPGLGGQPPWQFTGDLRLRLSRQVLLDLTRSYFFNFADNRWSPQFGIQFAP